MSAGLRARVEAQLHQALARGARQADAGAFAVFLWPEPNLFYRDRALPLARPADWSQAIATMVARFAAVGRWPRVEHLAESWPRLAAALRAHGFVQEGAVPVLVAERACGGTGPPARLLAADDPLVEDAIRAARRIFDVAPTAQDAVELAGLRADLAAGKALYAVVVDGARPVAGGALLGFGEVAELVAVWTAAAWRGRGCAAAVCDCLMERFFARGGALVWCTAASERAAGLYTRLGFRRIATQIDHVLPLPP